MARGSTLLPVGKRLLTSTENHGGEGGEGQLYQGEFYHRKYPGFAAKDLEAPERPAAQARGSSHNK